MMAFFPKSGPNPFTMVTKRLRQDLPDRKFLQYGPNTYVSNKMVVAYTYGQCLSQHTKMT